VYERWLGKVGERGKDGKIPNRTRVSSVDIVTLNAVSPHLFVKLTCVFQRF
jgi:hypothetical protein